MRVLGYDGVLLESLVWEDRHSKLPLLSSFLTLFKSPPPFFFSIGNIVVTSHLWLLSC